MKRYCPECKSVFEDDQRNCPKDGTKLLALGDEEVDPLLGAVFEDRWKIEELLGEGGMGTVYRGMQLSVNRPVAIKVLRRELLDREVALERFFREAKIVSEMTHPNIVNLIDFGQDLDRNLLYLVMELVKGHNLGDLLEQARFRCHFALEVIYQVCGALTEPHARGVIHRDLKPDNLLLVPISDGTIQVKVLDFGIARPQQSETQLTATGMVCGTPAYMAPEQAQNQELTPQTDLYALGVILYEMLTGWPPFRGTNSLQIMIAQIQETHRPLRELMPPSLVPPEVEQLVDSMLQKSSSDRPESARAVRDEIERICREHNMDLVRVEPGSDSEDLYKNFFLPSFAPEAYARKNITAALRRETGMEPQFDTDEARALAEEDTADMDRDSQEAYVTNERVRVMAGAATSPVTPERRLEIMEQDARRGGATNLGPAQAWTPAAQLGVQPKQLGISAPKQSSEPPSLAPPSDPQIASASPRDKTTAARQSPNVSNRRLMASLIAIVVVIVCVAGAAIYIALNKDNKTYADGAASGDPATSVEKSEAGAADRPPNNARTAVSSATSTATGNAKNDAKHNTTVGEAAETSPEDDEASEGIAKGDAKSKKAGGSSGRASRRKRRRRARPAVKKEKKLIEEVEPKEKVAAKIERTPPEEKETKEAQEVKKTKEPKKKPKKRDSLDDLLGGDLIDEVN